MKYGLIGEHLKHSYSCEIHAQIADYEYELHEIPPSGLSGFLKKREFNAINVTIPYKQDVIPYLDEISDTAKRIGAVNTIVNRNGRLYGDNTDFAGMLALAKHIGVDMKGRKVLILGTGGASKTGHALAEYMGAQSVYYVSRSGKDGSISYEQAVTEHSDAQIIINATPVGMFPKQDGRPIDISAFPKLEGVIDAIYNPLRTNLVLDAQERGIPAEGGLYMLSAQAVHASAVFRDIPLDESLVDKAFKSVKKSPRGFPADASVRAAARCSMRKMCAHSSRTEFSFSSTADRKTSSQPTTGRLPRAAVRLKSSMPSDMIYTAPRRSCTLTPIPRPKRRQTQY